MREQHIQKGGNPQEFFHHLQKQLVTVSQPGFPGEVLNVQ